MKSKILIQVKSRTTLHREYSLQPDQSAYWTSNPLQIPLSVLIPFLPSPNVPAKPFPILLSELRNLTSFHLFNF